MNLAGLFYETILLKDGVKMMDAATAYFLKKYYPHVIKWLLVVYNPEAVRIWPSKQEKEEALRIEAEEAERLALEGPVDAPQEVEVQNEIDSSAFNASTGSYSGLYGQQPVDENTQATLQAILYASSNQSSIDLLIAGGQRGDDVITPPEQNAIITEANEIYERLLREAAEDEARKQAEIEEMRKQAELTFAH